MAIKRTKYNYTTSNGLDTFHFQTDDEQVKVLDSNKKVLGSFKEYALEGKVVNSGSFKNLKVSGLYRVKNLSGLPQGYDVNKISILSVKSVGNINNPVFTLYTLVSQNGDIYHNTVVGTQESGWTEGGTALENTLTDITNDLGEKSSLKTTNKTNIVGAVNELDSRVGSNTTRLSSAESRLTALDTHNHDDKYLKLSGGNVTGNVRLNNGKSLIGKNANGSSDISLIKTTNQNNIVVGDTSSQIKINSTDIVNSSGNKVWHADNDGAGSGLDADKLDGVHHSDFAKLSNENRFKKNVVTDGNMYVGEDIYFGENYSNRLNQITSASNGTLSIGKSTPVTISNSGRMTTKSDIVIGSQERWAGLRFSLNGSKGIGFERDKNHGALVLHNWDNSKNIFRANEDGVVHFGQNHVTINGRALYLTPGEPSSSAPTGSIWIQV